MTHVVVQLASLEVEAADVMVEGGVVGSSALAEMVVAAGPGVAPRGLIAAAAQDAAHFGAMTPEADAVQVAPTAAYRDATSGAKQAEPQKLKSFSNGAGGDSFS